MSRRRPIFLFVAIAYAMSIALSLVVGLTGGYQSNLIGLRYLSMLIPAVSVLIVQTVMREGPCVRWDRVPPSYIPLAIFLIPAVMPC